MRKTTSLLLFVVLVLFQTQPVFLSSFLEDVDAAFFDLLNGVFPYLHIDLYQIVALLFFFTLMEEVYSQQGAMRMAGLKLKNYLISGEGRVLRLSTASQTNETVQLHDFLKDICYLEKRFNSWLLILLILGTILAPGLYLSLNAGNALYLLPFMLVALIFFFILAQGNISIATADGARATVLTSKGKGSEILDTVSRQPPGGFVRVSLSDIFSEREVYLHSCQIAGVVQVSKFPWDWLVIFLVSAVGAYLVIRSNPDYMIQALILPAIILMITIYLALQKRTLVKMTGGHYYSVGNSASAEDILSYAVTQKG